MYAVTAARILVAGKWKNESVPTILEWQMLMLDYLQLAKLTGGVRGEMMQKTFGEWKIFKEYIRIYCNNKAILAELE